MGDFSMTEYYHQYMDALHDLDRAKQRVEARKDSSYALLCIEDEEDYEQWKADVAAAEAELKAAQDEVKRLEYLSRTGKEPPEPDSEHRKPNYGGGEGYTHFPTNPQPPKHIIPQ